MAMSDKPPTKDNEEDEESKAIAQLQIHHESHSSPNSSSSGSLQPSSPTLTARKGSGEEADASPASIERDTPTKTGESRREVESGDTAALSYFAPAGAGRLTFSPPVGVCSQTSPRVHPCVVQSSSGESVTHQTPTEQRGELSAASSKATPPAEQLQKGQRGNGGLVYYSAVPGSYGAESKGPAFYERLAIQQPFAAASALRTSALPANLSCEQRPLAAVPSEFIRSAPWFEYPAAVTLQQPLSAAGTQGAVPEAWISQQPGYAGATAALDSWQLQQQKHRQGLGNGRNAQQAASTSTPVAFFVGTPRQSQYAMESSGYLAMRSQQPYTAAPLLLSEKSRYTGGATMGQQELATARSRRLHQGSHTLGRDDVRDFYTSRHGQYPSDQPTTPRMERAGYEGGSRRRRRALWDCYEELVSPRDFLPMLSGSRTRISRNLREILRSRRRDLSHVLQRIQDAVSRYCQPLTQSSATRYTPEYALQQSSDRSELLKAGPEERFLSSSRLENTPYVVISQQEYAGSGEGKEAKKGREAVELLWRDGRVLLGERGLPPKLLYADAVAPAIAEGVRGAEGHPGKPEWELSRKDQVFEVVPLSSSRGVVGKYYTASTATPSTHACPTCGGSQVLVLGDAPTLAAVRAAPKETGWGDGALQRLLGETEEDRAQYEAEPTHLPASRHPLPLPRTPLPEKDVDGCLQRLGEWRCTLCSDLAEAVDDEVLHTGGLVQQGGEWVDQVVGLVVRGFADTLRSFFLMIPRPSPQVVEGYPLYEPDYTYLSKKGRPTSLTGNFCIDQLNAFLDACLVEDDFSSTLTKAPPVPETTRTGHWLIDAANAALDKLSAEEPPPPPPSYKGFCPPVETLLPPCCTGAPLLPPRPPPRQTTICPLLDICSTPPARPGSECPHCHQPLRSGVCPAESPRGRRLKGLFDECLTPRKQAAEPPPSSLYAYEASPVGYYVPTGTHQAATDYYAPVCGSSAPSAVVEKQAAGRAYYTPIVAAVEAQRKMPEWVSPAAPLVNCGNAEAARACQYPYAPVYATRPCSEGFTVDAGVQNSTQPRA